MLHIFINMVPTLSTLRLTNCGVKLAQLIVIITLLPFSSHTRVKDNILIYSSGPCLILRFFQFKLEDSSSSSFPTLGSSEVPLKIAGKNCTQNDPGWITSIDYYIEPSNSSNYHLVWADSDTQSLWTGVLNLSNFFISDVKQLAHNNGSNIGSPVRSLVIDQSGTKLVLSLPYLHRIEVLDISDGLPVIGNSDYGRVVKFTRNVLLSDVKIGKVLYNQKLETLFWIESYNCLWSKSMSSRSNEDDERKLLMCSYNPSNGLIYSYVIDPESDDVYIFYNKGRIERLSGPDWSDRSTVITNCLVEEKYQDVKFYTIELIKEEPFLRFYISDTQHYAFLQISLIKRFEPGQNADGQADESEYILDSQNSRILFTDAPNIYDFVFIGNKVSKKSTNKQSQTDKQLDSNVKVTSTEKFPETQKYQSMNKPILELVTKDLPISEDEMVISKLTLPPIDNLDDPLSKIVLTGSLSMPVEESSPSITSLSATSASIHWIYAFLVIVVVLAASWTLISLLGLKRNYQKVVCDDNILKENLTCVKY